MTELDKKLQEMALLNWNQFVQLVGSESIIKAKVCLLRRDKKSYGEIANKLGISGRQAEYACVKCEIKN